MPRRSRRSARLRLTLQYSGTFLVLGTALILVLYQVATRGSTVTATFPVSSGTAVSHAVPAGMPTTSRPLLPGVTLTTIQTKTGKVQAVRILDPAGVQRLQRNADLSRLLVASWIVLALTTVLSAVLGWFVAGRVLAPLRAMTAGARSISAGNLDRRLALTGAHDEFKQLGDEFDGLLGRLQSAFEAQRRFVANASHELRTPLTVDRTLLQVTLADAGASVESLRAACEELLASGREQERLLDALLTLASSERGIDRHVRVDLAALAAAVADAAAAGAATRSISIRAELEPAPSTGDPALLTRLIANLVDNAIRYNHPGGDVRLRTGLDGDWAVLSVANTGPPIAADAEALFEPFVRLAQTRPAEPDGHHGLGLSIVRAIAVSHGGSVAAVPQERGGLIVTVRFPAPDPA